MIPTQNETRRFFSASPGHGCIRYHLAVIGDAGAVQFHFSVYASEALSESRSLFPFWPYQPWGVEIHTRCGLGDSPDHENCWLLNAPCKHDGSSLYASEVMMPLFLHDGSDAVYARLESRYRDEFEIVDEGGAK